MRLTIICVTTGLLAGCLVGPDFKAPDRKMPAGWVGAAPTTAPTTQASIATAGATDVSQWWRNFNDAQLDALIDRAIVTNLDLRQAESRLRQARAQRGVVSSSFWPQLNTSASYRRHGSEGSARVFVDPGTGVVNSTSAG